MYTEIVKRHRAYQKVRRAEAEQATRARIVDALIELHQEVGPARTTVSAVADRAGVERLTVYRHFPDEPSMIRACSACWNERNPAPPLPQPGAGNPVRVCRQTLLQLYTWYRSNARMLTRILADAAELEALRESVAPMKDYLDDVASHLDRLWPRRNAQRLATLRHAVEFSTWQSLSGSPGNDRAAVTLVMTWLDACATGPSSRPRLSVRAAGR